MIIKILCKINILNKIYYFYYINLYYFIKFNIDEYINDRV